MDDDQENQKDELLALGSIFEDEETFIAHEDGSGGSFYANVELPTDCTIKLSGHMLQQARALGASLEESGENGWVMQVKYLPPIELNFKYPTDYPSKSAPGFILSCKWLSVKQLNKLCLKLDEIWAENQGDVVIYSWTDFLKTEALNVLELTSPITLDTSDLPRTVRQRSHQPGPAGDNGGDYDGAMGGIRCNGAEAPCQQTRVVQDIAALPNLIPTIVTYDADTREHVFRLTLSACGVCFDEKFGKNCIKFDACGHVYCKDCMREHFSVKIKDGDVKGLVCPDTECESLALPAQVKALVDPELYEKYDKDLLDLSLSEMGDIVFCPRTACQTVVVREEGNLGQCPACRLAFCVLCKNTFHGLAPCKMSREQYKKMMDDYENGTEDEKAILEQRYGKHKLRQVIENCNSEEWIRKHSKHCPNCDRSIQKFDGCNKMTCTKCRTYFCWLCFFILPRSDPYSHYRGNGSCANLLFQGLGRDGADIDDEEDDGNGDVGVVNIQNWWQFV